MEISELTEDDPAVAKASDAGEVRSKARPGESPGHLGCLQCRVREMLTGRQSNQLTLRQSGGPKMGGRAASCLNAVEEEYKDQHFKKKIICLAKCTSIQVTSFCLLPMP